MWIIAVCKIMPLIKAHQYVYDIGYYAADEQGSGGFENKRYEASEWFPIINAQEQDKNSNTCF